ncbi:hypothetical protein FACS189450_09750 [Spirochaetia bacterium]|nr:hypothetical protein FACS189450_09750 [Spirochaetia bacterium]
MLEKFFHVLSFLLDVSVILDYSDTKMGLQQTGGLNMSQFKHNNLLVLVSRYLSEKCWDF